MSDPTAIEFREKLDIGQIFLLQLNRTNIGINSLDEAAYEAMVRQLMRQLPQKSRLWVLEQTDEYNLEIERFDYNYFCGVPIGTPENPMMKENDLGIPYQVERDEKGNINWDDPNIISPHLVSETITDYEELNTVIMRAAENDNLTWRVDTWEEDAGDTEEEIERKRTPYRFVP